MTQPPTTLSELFVSYVVVVVLAGLLYLQVKLDKPRF